MRGLSAPVGRVRATARRLAACVLLLAPMGCGDGAGVGDDPAADGPAAGYAPADSGLHFTDVTRTSGVDVIMVSDRVSARELIESTGTGLALVDHDGDGDLDIFVPNGATIDHPSQGAGASLHENLGDMRFRDVTAESGITFAGWGMGVAVGDVDGDARDDLFIACFGSNVLLRNAGKGRFEDMTAEAGVAGRPVKGGGEIGRGWSTGCAFGDVDGDGDLDLYVANYVEFNPAMRPKPAHFLGIETFRGPMSLRGVPDELYLNRGDGTFEDVSDTWGITAPDASYGLGAVILDLDGDGAAEIFVGNDSERNFLFDDAGGDVASAPGAARKLVDRGLLSGVALSGTGKNQATMGIAIGDVDGDGLPDLFTSNFSSDANTLYQNVNGQLYDDATSRYGLFTQSRVYLGWSTSFCDFDNDGDEDLLVVNGHIYPHATMETMDSEARQPPLLFARGAKRFERVLGETGGAWLDEARNDRNAALGDLDGDGDVDLVIGELGGRVRLLRNDSTGPGAGLVVELSDTRPGTGNHRGLGSRLELRVTGGAADGSVQRRWIYSGGGYQTASGAFAHFALPADAEGLELSVTWPDGETTTRAVDASSRRLVVERP